MATFTILDETKIKREWIDDLINGTPDSNNAPISWIEWKNNLIHHAKGSIVSESKPIDSSLINIDSKEDIIVVDNIGTSGTNAWIVIIKNDSVSENFRVTIDEKASASPPIHDGDGIVIVDIEDGHPYITAFARQFRQLKFEEKTIIYFDGILKAESKLSLDKLEISSLDESKTFTRLEWSIFENALEKAFGIKWESFPVLKGETADDRAYIRELLQRAVVDDLLGPASGPNEEIIGMSVRDRYLVGKLAPMNAGSPGIEGTQSQDDTDGSVVEDDFHPYEGHHQPGQEFSATKGGQDTDDEESQEVDASTNQSLVPSSMGFTFCIDSSVKKIEIEITWGRYVRTTSERINEKTEKPYRCWKRIPCGGILALDLSKRSIPSITPDPDNPSVVLQGDVSPPLPNGDKLITIFLVNGQSLPDQNQDEAWLFQPEMIVRDTERRAIFRRRPVLASDSADNERVSLEMIYRNRVEFAVGHGVSVHATPSDKIADRAIKIRTSVLPEYEVPVTETPGSIETDRPTMRKMVSEGLLEMKRLSEIEREGLIDALSILVDDYDLWIKEQKSRIGSEVIGYDEVAGADMAKCSSVLERLKEGIQVLEKNDKALEAFRFANRAMALQRVHGIYSLLRRRGENPDIDQVDIAKNRTWRPFQLTFVLLSIPALADPTHKDRTVSWEAYADLLWFPTGGGKTEAYLGVAAFTMAIRRLQGELGGYDASRGLAVIMRYTLRLLTIQQFQRATTLICAMEVIRREDPEKWGNTPFTIGLWVGGKVTPNTTEKAHEAIRAIKEGKRQLSSSPHQITACPWCGAEIVETRDIEVRRFKSDVGRTLVYCGDSKQRCSFSKRHSRDLGIPVSVVDEEIYRRPPSMLIATVDKFAMMAWKGEVRNLFGKARLECERHGLLWDGSECKGNHPKKKGLPATKVKMITPIRPPDLIIQDEFHLIAGPLGTMVGLYETAVDELSTWTIDGKTVRPKIVASTATARKAAEQVNGVFLRKVSIFPPHGLDVEDNFFSVQRPIEDDPGRLYIGICSPGSSRPAVLIRVYVALLTAAQSLFERFEKAADPYMTVVGYFNSLRELGGMRRLAEDDVQTRSYRVQMSAVARPGLSQRSVKNVDELTSRVSSKDIPRKLDQLEVNFKSVWKKGELRAMDIVLATNMLSVGVDVNRLGLMVVNGQPKSTAEYIQATSRVGRAFPGLVCTVLTWSRPRDLSHYETFEHYHATFYKHVEAQSVTPFAPRALDRGLMGTTVSLLRLGSDDLNPNKGAQKLDDTARPDVLEAKKVLSDRAWKIMDKAEARTTTEGMLDKKADLWVKEATKKGRKIGYQARRGQGDLVALLKRPSALPWHDFTVPTSMREVEPSVGLIMDESTLPDPPPWRSKPSESGKGGVE